jgi:hypothetical protein
MFALILAISEINAFLVALWYFIFANGTMEVCPTLLVFHQWLAWQVANIP